MTSRRSIVFDLDDTICSPIHTGATTEEKYGKALPNQEVIDGMHKLAKAGFHITSASSRRMLTHNGDIEKILDDVGEITWQWLEDHDVPYHELVFGKPYSSTYYVDDKAMTPEMFCQKVDSML